MTEQERPGGRRALGPLVAAGVLLLLWSTLQFGWVDWTALRNWAIPRAIQIVMLVVALTFAVAGGWAWRRTPRYEAQVPGLTWWVVVIAAVVVTGVAWGATSWLLAEADSATDRGAARVDAIKTGLGIGAGTTGVFALLLAVRRQTHQEHAAADTSFDATEKRVTELYTKAVEQLGSGHAAVRLGGLYALERLAQDNPKHRQTIVNVLCAYLRMHYELSGNPPDATAENEVKEEYRERVREREVRLTAQAILRDHLQSEHGATFWDSINIDLTGALLIDFILMRSEIGEARFTKAVFAGEAKFSGAEFSGMTWFDEATFIDAVEFKDVHFAGTSWLKVNFADLVNFDKTTFTDVVSFHEAKFAGKVNFERVIFMRAVTFERVVFAGATKFQEVYFAGMASFDEASFMCPVVFDRATFNGTAKFDMTTFTGKVAFRDVNFDGAAVFRKTSFVDVALFLDVAFAHMVMFNKATFTGAAFFEGVDFAGTARFDKTEFATMARFDGATFAGTTSVDRTTFAGTVKFSGATFAGETSFDMTTFAKEAWFDEVNFGGATSFSMTTFADDVRFDRAVFAGTVSFEGTTAKAEPYLPPQLRSATSTSDQVDDDAPPAPSRNLSFETE